MAPAGFIRMYAAASERVILQLALSNIAVTAWPSDKDHDKRDKTIRDLTAYAVPGYTVRPGGSRGRIWMSSDTLLARDAIAQSFSLAYELLTPFVLDSAFRVYQGEVTAYIRSGSHELPPIFLPIPGNPVFQTLESDVFLLEVLHPFLKGRGLLAPPLPSVYVWNALGELTPGWGAFLSELRKHVATIVFLQLAVDEHQRKGHYPYADRNKVAELWMPHLDRMLHDWLVTAVTSGVIPAAQVRSTFDSFSKKTVYVPR